MNWLSRTFSILALMALTSACTAGEMEVLEPTEFRQGSSYIVINAIAHPIRLPLDSLAGASFIGDSGEIINYTASKGLYVTTVTPGQWGNPAMKVSDIPAYIFEKDPTDIQEDSIRNQVEGLRRIMLGEGGEKKIAKMALKDTTIYIAHHPSKTNILITSPDKPNLYTNLVLDGYTWDEINNEILKGIERN